MDSNEIAALFFFLGGLAMRFIIEPLADVIVRLIEKLISKWRNKK